MVETITKYSLVRAADEAVKLWALASAQYPMKHQLILDTVQTAVVETASAFALNTRRAMETLHDGRRFRLASPRWHWALSEGGEIVNDLWDALNRIIHAQKLSVGFIALPNELAVIDGGAVVIPFVQAATDRKQLAFIDPFALSHAFLYEVMPKCASSAGVNESPHVQ